MSQYKTEPVSSGAFASAGLPRPASPGSPSQSVPPVSVSASRGEAALPTEPHPNPKPSDKEFQREAIQTLENEGGHPIVHVSHEQIARRAYEIYEESGCVPGRCAENWHQAERELRKLILAKQDFKNKEE